MKTYNIHRHEQRIPRRNTLGNTETNGDTHTVTL